jgi:hypothetical protein
MSKRRKRRSPPSSLAAITWIGLGWLLRAGSLALAFYAVSQDWGGEILIPIIPFAVAYGMIRRGQKMRAVRAEALMASDPRPPVLYLRSFLDEDQDKGPVGAARSAKGSTQELSYSTPPWGVREQEALSILFREVGPYVAIGKPGERLPELGAARMYVPDQKWQSRVKALCASAQLVIVRAGVTAGLRWEVEHLVESVSPLKLLFLLPARTDNYGTFQNWVSEVLPVPLPIEVPSGRLLMFDADWNPRVLPPRSSLKRSLAPFFEQNGIQLKERFLEAFLEHNGLRS